MPTQYLGRFILVYVALCAVIILLGCSLIYQEQKLPAHGKEQSSPSSIQLTEKKDTLSFNLKNITHGDVVLSIGVFALIALAIKLPFREVFKTREIRNSRSNSDFSFLLTTGEIEVERIIKVPLPFWCASKLVEKARALGIA